MRYRLDEILDACREFGVTSERIDKDRVDVVLEPGCTLSFLNLDGVDSLVGFDGTPWHSHDLVPFTTIPPEYIECDWAFWMKAMNCPRLGLGSLAKVANFHCLLS